jgi:hypothetical protein
VSAGSNREGRRGLSPGARWSGGMRTGSVPARLNGRVGVGLARPEVGAAEPETDAGPVAAVPGARSPSRGSAGRESPGRGSSRPGSAGMVRVGSADVFREGSIAWLTSRRVGALLASARANSVPGTCPAGSAPDEPAAPRPVSASAGVSADGVASDAGTAGRIERRSAAGSIGTSGVGADDRAADGCPADGRGADDCPAEAGGGSGGRAGAFGDRAAPVPREVSAASVSAAPAAAASGAAWRSRRARSSPNRCGSEPEPDDTGTPPERDGYGH